jgi:hypothetical protein
MHIMWDAPAPAEFPGNFEGTAFELQPHLKYEPTPGFNVCVSDHKYTRTRNRQGKFAGRLL